MLKKIIFMMIISSSSFASFTDIFSSDNISAPIIELVELEYERIIKDPGGSKFLANVKARGDLTAFYDITTGLITGECTPWQPDGFFYRVSRYDGKLAEELGIAYNEIQKNYCGKLEEYNEYFVKNILNEFNDEHGTNISLDDLDGTSELVSLGIQKDEIPLWEKNGITKEEIRNWAKANVITLDEALEWKKYNYTSNNVSYWKMNGISTPKEAAKWGSIDDYITCNSYQQTDINVVMAWREVNVPCNKMKSLIALGNTPESFLGWESLGITNSLVLQRWKEKGFSTPQSAKVWIEKGITEPYEIQDWINEGITSPGEVAKWKSIGINTARETRSWFQNLPVKNVDDVAIWVEAGVKNTSDFVNWRNLLGVTTVEQILGWKSVGANTPYEALKLKKKGIKPQIIKKNTANINQENTSIQSFSSVNNVHTQNKNVSNVVYDEQSNFTDNGAEVEPHVIINTRQLNVRSGNGRDNQIVGQLTDHDTMIVLGCIEASYGGDVWCKIDANRPYNSFIGWVNSDFIEGTETKEAPYKVINIPMNDTLTIRQGNSAKTQKVGDIERNARGIKFQMCAVNEHNQEWCKINYPNLKGWVMKKYVDFDF